ncbi:MT-A70 family methyltransferase [Yersinia enterocolitica]|uniref:MT-A70 family methyltransferase n=1 Tax=Yersinia enterocolitica TaxID=630 RepID=UPI00065A8D82|nr:MT-A70 family methyltransferase [Yersinia enterocolitica]CRY19529.1 putative adenine-specific modification methylase [Yersinia enterocolitica]
MRYGSVCSGIEAVSLAWEPLGWAATWFSEIEPFPSAVLAHRWPTVTNLGDMTKIAELVRSGSVEAPDILVGGTPCQAFSVAGLRNGLADARGQLTLSYVELADAIDDTRRQRGEKKSIIVWENVPGVLSSKDNAFGCFLAALAGEDEPLVPSGEKWTNAGYVSGPKRAIAWIIKDAQYFGVAQRRRRVFVVASARDDINPAEILFEFDGLRRDSAPSRESGKAVAALTANGVGTCGADDNQATAGHLVLSKAFRMTALGEYADDDTASTCKARDYKDATDLAIAFNWQAGGNTSSTLGFREISGALQCNNIPAVLFQKEQQSTCIDIPLYAFSYKDYGGDASVDISPTLRAGNSCESNANGGQPPAVAYCLQHAQIGRVDTAGPQGKGWQEEVGFTLDSRSTADAVVVQMAVRRLTPRECERLQGMPDDHTLIPYGRAIRPEKMAEDYARYLMRGGRTKSFEDCCRAAADGPRYKAIGNSMAVNVMQWLGQRIAAALPPPLYDVIYADPPWQYGSKPNRGVSLEYSTMSLTELCTMQVRGIASPNSALFMWVTGAMVSEALTVGAAWGFKFIRIDKVWEKKKHTGSRHGVVGPWGMNDAEFLLLFTRGKVCSNQTERNQYTVYEEKYTGTHSGKPHFFREQIERRFKNARRIELFARTSSPGWDVWGDQAPNAKSLALLEPEEAE